MIRDLAPSTKIGVAAIGIHEPSWILGNEWFDSILPRKFVQHTGIECRRISLEDEVAMGVRAAEDLRRKVNWDPGKCVGVVLASSTLIPGFIGRKYLDERRVQAERADLAARRFAKRLGIRGAKVIGINWGCSGFAKALSIVQRFILADMHLRQDEFVLIATVNRISKVLDYACRDTAGLFGDAAEVTLVAGSKSTRYPVHFEVLFCGAETQPVDGAFFHYHVRENVLVPTPGGGKATVPMRLVFSLNPLGIADVAPRAMAAVAAKALRAARIRPEEPRFVVPHQAGTGMIRLTAMKLEQIGVRGEVINGVNCDIANVSSSSIPHALFRQWDRLDGTIVCPTAGVGNPGDAKVSQGCVVLKATEHHSMCATRAFDGNREQMPAR